MRRFELTGPSVLIGGVQFSRIEHTILVREGQVAVLADDDPRCDDLARSPYLRELIEPTSPESDDETTDAPSSTKRRKSSAESDGV